MGLFSTLFGKKSSVEKDAARLYMAVLEQSRNPAFYGVDRVPDNYDGRIDVLTLHIAPILKALNAQGENGHRLGQALFDQMKDDFEIALREEAIGDTGVKKRIKPMIALFYARVKIYTEALLGPSPEVDVATALQSFYPDHISPEFAKQSSAYLMALSAEVDAKTLGEIALMNFAFPELSA